MNLLAAAAAPTQPAPAYNPAYQQNQQHQNTTVQQDKPVQKASLTTKALVYGNLMFNLAVVVIIVVMVCKFVLAFEKIARTFEKGIVIKKDDTTPTT